MAAELVLGPMLRRTEDTTAAVWVQTSEAATVTVRLTGRADGTASSWSAGTFAVHGHHYALVETVALPAGERAPYEVLVDDVVRWPPPDSPFPASTLPTSVPDGRVRLAFGSCRTSVPHDAVHQLSHGVDALRTFALALASGDVGPVATPDLLLLLGDQVYADATSDQMKEFIAARRDLDEEPGDELADFTEYAHLYRLAWGEPALRWLFSSLPSLMIFDDHDIRDDWNTSASWRRQMAATSWWHGRIVAGLGSYWVYQHLGNLTSADRARDPLWIELQRRRKSAPEGVEVDLTDAVDAFAERADAEPASYRWSYTHQLGGSRLVVVDSRAARELEPSNRSMLDDAEMAWLDEQLTGDVEHLLVATSLPFLLPMGLHHVEALDEALAQGRLGRRWAGIGERLRQGLDLEHWAAFGESFAAVAEIVTEVADGRRGAPPSSVLFLSGDVHFSYITEVDRASGSRMLQLVCSPIRNPLPRALRAFAALGSHAARPVGSLLSRWAKIPEPPWRWHGIAGPWFDNNLAVLTIDDGELHAVWVGGVSLGGDGDRPELEVVADLELDVPPAGSTHGRPLARVRRDGGRGLLGRLRRRTTARR